MTTNERVDLGLTDTSASTGGGCGGGNCACSSGDASTGTAEIVIESVISTELLVAGMTCSHCVSSVTEELSDVDGVRGVTVDLQVGGASRVTVHSAAPIDATLLRAAVEEAGYALVGDPS